MITRVQLLPDAEVEAVLDLVRAATVTDGVSPLNEEGMLGLASSRDDRTHVLAHHEGSLVGYACRNESTGAAVVHPDHRRTGIGRTLVRALLDLEPAPLRIWAHGDHPGASALAHRLGFTPVRELWQLRSSLHEPLPPVVAPPGVTIRTFQPGVDDQAWLELNAAAFATHPEQGRWTQIDLQERLDQPWFDPSGFFLAEIERKLVGFHWTKRRGDGGGEIYVLGIHPDRQGLGLGKTLAVTGLRYLREQGLATATLFVEADNTPAVRLYQKLGFAHARSDVMYRYPG